MSTVQSGFQQPPAGSQRWSANGSDLTEVQALRQELADTQRKLQGYADKVISLYDELRMLRENICSICKGKLVLKVPAASPTGGAASSSLLFHRETLAESTNVWRRILKHRRRSIRNSAPDRPCPVAPNIRTAVDPIPPDAGESHGSLRSIPVPLTLPPSTSPILPKPEPKDFQWFAKQDGSSNRMLHVTFVRSFMHNDVVRAARFSTDGKYLAAIFFPDERGYTRGQIFIYNVESGEKVCVLAEYRSQYSSKSKSASAIECMSFSPNSRFLVVGNLAGLAMMWDIQNKRVCNVFKGHWVSVDFSPNGRLVLSTSLDETVRIWNLRDGSARVFSGYARGLSARFNPDGQYIVAAGGSDRVLRMWHVRSGCPVKKWTGCVLTARNLVFTPDGKRLLCGCGRVVKYWDVGSLVPSSREPVVTEYRGHTGIIRCVASSPDGQWVAASSDETVIVWDTLTAIRQYTLVGHKDTVLSVDFSPAGTYLATSSEDGNVALWKYT